MRPLTTFELNCAVKSRRGDIGQRLGFMGTFPIDRIPSPVRFPCCVIANTDPSSMPGEHWVVLLIKPDGSGEFFDSFGLPPSVYGFHRWFPSHRVTVNPVMLQKSEASCGYFCLYYLYHRASGLRMGQIVHSLSRLQDDEFVWRSVRSLFSNCI